MNPELNQAIARLSPMSVDPGDIEVRQTRCRTARLGCKACDSESWTVLIHDKRGIVETATRLDQALARIESRLEGAAR